MTEGTSGEYDPYPKVSQEQIRQLISLFEEAAPTPDDVKKFNRVRGGFDLEFEIYLTEAGGAAYTEEVCKDLKIKVVAMLDHPAPVLRFYVNGKPTPETAREEEEDLRYRYDNL